MLDTLSITGSNMWLIIRLFCQVGRGRMDGLHGGDVTE